jgi:ribosome biogenesis GTPase A
VGFKNPDIFLLIKKNDLIPRFLRTSLYHFIKESNYYPYAAHGKEYQDNS